MHGQGARTELDSTPCRQDKGLNQQLAIQWLLMYIRIWHPVAPAAAADPWVCVLPDCREGRWVRLAPMSVPRSSHSVAALQGKLYVAGGQCSSSDYATPTATAGTGGAGYGLGGLGGLGSGFGSNSSLVGGQDLLRGSLSGAVGSASALLAAAAPTALLQPFASGSYSPPGSSTGGLFGPMGHPGFGLGSSMGGSSSGGGMLGVLGGAEEGCVHHSMEVYDPAMNKWVQCAPMAAGRSGLALCAV